MDILSIVVITTLSFPTLTCDRSKEVSIPYATTRKWEIVFGGELFLSRRQDDDSWCENMTFLVVSVKKIDSMSVVVSDRGGRVCVLDVVQ